jgi:hypothetical protein
LREARLGAGAPVKAFKGVEATRREHYANSTVNTVHRSSLLVPELPGAVAEISFLNHFLLKRGYRDVACRITAVDPSGHILEARAFAVDEPRVYRVALTGAFSDPVATYHVEFFSAHNLVVPFPAVMINHRGRGFLNTVHAYNRVLNDVFEHDAINETAVPEAAIDVVLDDTTDTFVLFTCGPAPCDGEVRLDFVTGPATQHAAIRVKTPRLTHQLLSLGEVFPGLRTARTGILKVDPPSQWMFYGRLLVGRRVASGAFAANHSYYDSTSVPEYWPDARPSSRTYPFFAELENAVSVYPIMSPGRLAFRLVLHDRAGRRLAETVLGDLTSPGTSGLHASVREVARASGVPLEDVSAFTLVADGDPVPTRVNHQLIYHAGALASSINVSLGNSHVFVPDAKSGLTWGQVPVGRALDSWLGLVTKSPDGAPTTVDCTLFGEGGEIGRLSRPLLPGAALILRPEDFGAGAELDAAEPRYLWFTARSPRRDISAYVVTRHRDSGHCTGEHSF